MIRSAAAALAALLMLTGCQTTGSLPDPFGFDRGDLLHAFDKSAYGWEFSEKDRNNIIRYEEPLRVLLVREGEDEAVLTGFNRVMSFIRALYRGPEIDSITVVDVRNSSREQVRQSNMVIFAVGPTAYEAVHARLTQNHVKQGRGDVANLFYFNRCGGFISSQDGRITRTIVMMDVQQASNRENYRALDECFAEEILQGLGLPNDHDSLKWSMFNDSNGLLWPGEFDRMLLSMLYSDALSPDMPRTEAARHLPGIIDQLWPSFQSSKARRAAGDGG